MTFQRNLVLELSPVAGPLQVGMTVAVSKSGREHPFDPICAPLLVEQAHVCNGNKRFITHEKCFSQEKYKICAQLGC
jgi:hypothetical protein